MATALRGTFIYAGLLACIWVIAVLQGGVSPYWPVSAGLMAVFIVLTWFDLDHFRIPNWISLPLLAGGFGFALSGGLDWRFSLVGAGVGYGMIWGLNVYWRKYRARDGIGMGDAKLLAAAGAWLGVYALPFLILIASTSALLAIVALAILRREPVRADQRIPFGPFIGLGFWTVWIAGPGLLAGYAA